MQTSSHVMSLKAAKRTSPPQASSHVTSFKAATMKLPIEPWAKLVHVCKHIELPPPAFKIFVDHRRKLVHFLIEMSLDQACVNCRRTILLRRRR